VNSTTAQEEYGWLKDIPQIREWIGDRQINALAADGYTIKNKDYELTVSVNANDINDDKFGIYAPRFKFMGDEVARFPSRLAIQSLSNGFTTKCYDGQNFFDAAHPYLQKDGTIATQSNNMGGAGTPWYLLCTSRPLKPIIYQERQAFNFVSLDRPDNPDTFMRKQLVYGTDGRCNVGYGFWQMAVGSKQTLDAAGFKAARLAMTTLLGDFGKALGLRPDLIVYPPSLQDNAEAVLLVQKLADGSDNPLYKAVDMLPSPYLL
jgi:phage major head subunit gpT-like protein